MSCYLWTNQITLLDVTLCFVFSHSVEAQADSWHVCHFIIRKILLFITYCTMSYDEGLVGFFLACLAYAFGSSVNRLGMKNCDLDMVILTNGDVTQVCLYFSYIQTHSTHTNLS